MGSRLRASRDRVLNLRRLSRTLAVVFTCANASLQSPACTNREISMSTTITSLLNSLQSHLQSHTQLLPTLHTQLGLPPTALADDLSTLEKQLTECVESQVNARREQVDEWMDRCSEVENFNLVLTTFHTVSAEWKNDRSSTDSVIFSTHWRRVILDEGETPLPPFSNSSCNTLAKYLQHM